MTSNREPADETNKEDPTQGIPFFLQPFTVDPVDLETYVLAHYSERENSDSDCDASKVETQKRKHSVHCLLPQKTKRDLFRELITAEQKVLSQGRESRNNHRYAVVVQVLVTQ